MRRRIEKCEVCLPIESLISTLKSKGFEVASESCRDIHFNEVEIRMVKCIGSAKVESINIPKIELHEKGFFFCKCHWSSVYLD